jgi:ligand-binding sensor domain-containing protein
MGNGLKKCIVKTSKLATMKSFKFIYILIIVCFQFKIIAQSVPTQFAYQAVIRDTQGKLIVDKKVGIMIELAQTSASGALVFTEEHEVTTNKQGLVSLEIGSKADLSIINWAQGPYFIVLSVDTEGGSYQLPSVPYALFAANGKWWFLAQKGIWEYQ